VSGFELRMIPFAIGMSLLLADNLRGDPEDQEPQGGDGPEAAEARRELLELRQELDQLKARLARDDPAWESQPLWGWDVAP